MEAKITFINKQRSFLEIRWGNKYNVGNKKLEFKYECILDLHNLSRVSGARFAASQLLRVWYIEDTVVRKKPGRTAKLCTRFIEKPKLKVHKILHNNEPFPTAGLAATDRNGYNKRQPGVTTRQNISTAAARLFFFKIESNENCRLSHKCGRLNVIVIHNTCHAWKKTICNYTLL